MNSTTVVRTECTLGPRPNNANGPHVRLLLQLVRRPSPPHASNRTCPHSQASEIASLVMYSSSSLAFPCYMNARGSRKQHDCHALSTSHRRCLHSSEALGSLPPCRISKANRLYEGFGACPCTARRFQARRYLCKAWFRTMHCCSEAYALARLSSGKSCVLIALDLGLSIPRCNVYDYCALNRGSAKNNHGGSIERANRGPANRRPSRSVCHPIRAPSLSFDDSRNGSQ